jgi:hypothetical protein
MRLQPLTACAAPSCVPLSLLPSRCAGELRVTLIATGFPDNFEEQLFNNASGNTRPARQQQQQPQAPAAAAPPPPPAAAGPRDARAVGRSLWGLRNDGKRF